jgi:hypothetical protein
MSFCTNCGSKFNVEARFCASCGSPRQGEVGPSSQLLEYGGIQTSSARFAPTQSIPRATMSMRSNSTSTLVMVFAIIQVVSLVLYLIFWTVRFPFGFDVIRTVHVPMLLVYLPPLLPIIGSGLLLKFRSDQRVSTAALIAGAFLGYKGFVTLFTADFWGFQWEQVLFYLANIGFATGIVLAILLAIGNRYSAADLAPEAERWRGALGFIAVLFLFLEKPGEVLFEEWPILSLIFFPLILVAFTLREGLRQGAALGLACVVGGSLISQSAIWLIGVNDWTSATFTSIPRLLALLACLGAIVPKSFFAGATGTGQLTR